MMKWREILLKTCWE